MLFLLVKQYQKQSDIAFALLVKSQHFYNPINLDETMAYLLTSVPYSLGTSDGFFNKTNKAATFHCILKSVPCIMLLMCVIRKKPFTSKMAMQSFMLLPIFL